MLLEKIKKDQIALRKSEERTTHVGKMKINALTTLIGEASPSGHNSVVSDEDVQKIVRKFVKNLDETLEQLGVDTTITSFEKAVDVLKECSKISMLLIERQMYMSYLPQVFDEIQIKEVVDSIQGANIGQIMGACKKAATSKGMMFDGSLVKKVIG